MSPAASSSPFHLFDAYGVELEYMIVDAETLDVRPIADRILGEVAGEGESEYDGDPIGWSNELVMHVLELKTARPARDLGPLPDAFERDVRWANQLLEKHGARLLPTGMHPWMDPHTQTKLWTHENGPIYQAYDRIFGCRGHGWSNLQSTHINLPFAGDDEFGRLHAAIRLVLPLIPALAASTPFVDGRRGPALDTRLETYRQNQRRVPMVTGRVIPEPVFSAANYQSGILDKVAEAIAPHDPDNILQSEWLNSRGAIARFSRGAIEIRVIDLQECPAMDLAVVELVSAAVRGLVEERWSSFEEQKAWQVDPLAEIFLQTVKVGEEAVVDNGNYLGMFGIEAPVRGSGLPAGDVWQSLASALLPESSPSARALATMWKHGTLARRIVRAVADDQAHEHLFEVYRELADCLADNRPFLS
jgi:gamma-glutamyl:cysteine ligase YbdK (ATP-grasp superfamily)